MRLTLLWMALTTTFVVPAQGAKFDATGTDLSNVALNGVVLGDSLERLTTQWPDAKVSKRHDVKVKNQVVGVRAVSRVATADGERTLIAHLTHDNLIYSIEIRDQLKDDEVGHPAQFVDRWIEQFGLPSKDYTVENERGRTYLTWYDMPRREKLMSIALSYDKREECTAHSPERISCDDNPWIYSGIKTTLILKDRVLEMSHRRTVKKILDRKKSLAE